MNQKTLAYLAILPLIVIYHLFFWHEKFGINLLLFSFLLVGLSLLFRKGSLFNPMWWFCSASLVITGIFVIVYNTSVSKFTHVVSLLLITSYSCYPALRSPIVALTNSLYGYCSQLAEWITLLIDNLCKTRTGLLIWHFTKLVFLPSVFIFIYVLLYSGSNAVFAQFFTNIVTSIFENLESLLKNISIPWMIFVGTGLLIITGIIMGLPGSSNMAFQNDGPDDLSRKLRYKTDRNPSFPNRNYRGYVSFKINTIRLQIKSGIFLLTAVNILLLIFNLTDAFNNWFGFEVPQNFNLKQFVHEATWYLVISILLSMAILLYYFRANINFYRKNKTIKILAFVWIIQNTILSVSVLLRNLHYINYHGLAYGRIGVLVFLFLVTVGLMTLYIKINKLKTISWLIRINAQVLFVSLIALSFINWDRKIVTFNLDHPNISEIDIDFYLTLSPQTYPILYEHLDLVEKQIKAHQRKSTRWSRVKSIEEFKTILSGKAQNFIRVHNQYSWVSFNIADQGAYNMLQKTQPVLFTELEKK